MLCIKPAIFLVKISSLVQIGCHLSPAPPFTCRFLCHLSAVNIVNTSTDRGSQVPDYLGAGLVGTFFHGNSIRSASTIWIDVQKHQRYLTHVLSTVYFVTHAGKSVKIPSPLNLVIIHYTLLYIILYLYILYYLVFLIVCAKKYLKGCRSSVSDPPSQGADAGLRHIHINSTCVIKTTIKEK